MKKIIGAFDGLNFSESTLEYAVELSKSTGAHLVGVFLDDFTHMSEGLVGLSIREEGFSVALQQLRQKDRDTRDKSVQHFTDSCKRRGIEHTVHRDKNIAIQDLLRESIYCDLLIIEARASMALEKQRPPTPFLKELLSEVGCPVLVVPPSYSPLNHVIFLYDGSPSSVLAVKMFDYVLSSLGHLTMEVVTVKPEDESLHLPYGRLMKEYMKRHYPKADYVVLKGNPEAQLLTYLSQPRNDRLIVLGAYQRSRLSRLFHHSMADVLLSHAFAPLFIAHSK